MRKKMKKVKKEVKIKDTPANYVVISEYSVSYFPMFSGSLEVKYFSDLLDVHKYIKTLSNNNKVRVFKIEEELKVKSKLELDL